MNTKTSQTVTEVELSDDALHGIAGGLTLQEFQAMYPAPTAANRPTASMVGTSATLYTPTYTRPALASSTLRR